MFLYGFGALFGSLLVGCVARVVLVCGCGGLW